MYKTDYFVRINGSCPASGWLDSLGMRESAPLFAKFKMLEAEGLKLLGTKVLKQIVGQPHLYEIRYSGYRIITYFDEKIDTFILLNGFRKQRMNERREILRGIELKNEYLAIQRGD